MKTTFAIPLALLAASVVPAFGQTETSPEINPPFVQQDEHHPCITAAEYAAMEAEIARNRTLLGLGTLAGRQAATISLQWPLKPAPDLQDCGYFYISAFVDQNTAAGAVKDWNCGTRTYDGHRGVDIVPWPFIWDKMDHNLVEVVAAAPGTIIAKVDGNFDRVCNPTGAEGNNYITVQHADGSTALYVHLKTGSMTAKTVGQAVSAGEFLGIPGSAGTSTGAHLHFEIRSNGSFGSYIDPFYGPCNGNITASWWAAQRPYAEPELMKLSLHSSWPYAGVCPITTDTLYEADHFTTAAGAKAVFYACSKHVSAGDSWTFKILNPDNTTFDAWNFTSLTNRNTSTLGWTRSLPGNPGIYTYEGVFNGVTCRKSFIMETVTASVEPKSGPAPRLFPNPSNGTIYLEAEAPGMSGKPYQVTLLNALGQTVAQLTTYAGAALEARLSPGFYYYTVAGEGRLCLSGRLVVEN